MDNQCLILLNILQHFFLFRTPFELSGKQILCSVEAYVQAGVPCPGSPALEGLHLARPCLKRRGVLRAQADARPGAHNTSPF